MAIFAIHEMTRMCGKGNSEAFFRFNMYIFYNVTNYITDHKNFGENISVFLRFDPTVLYCYGRKIKSSKGYVIVCENNKKVKL